MELKKIVSAITACVLVSGITFNIHTVDFKGSLQEVKAVSYDSDELAEYAEQVAVLVNEERSAYGLKPLRVSPILREAANIRVGELTELFSHERPDGALCFTAMDELQIPYGYAAENIAYGQKNPEKVMYSWMNSSGHRANILSSNMEYIGVGVNYQNGRYYWTQFFASSRFSDTSNILSDGAYLPEDIIITAAASTTTTTSTTITTTLTTTATTSTTTKSSTSTTTSTTAPTTTEPTEGTYKSFTYKNYGDHIEITGYEGSDTSFTIPAEIDGVTVTDIGNGAFYHYRNITEITIPDGVTTIGESAFEECSVLTKISIPDSVTTIGDGAFFGCEALTEITIPDSITSIGYMVFSSCLSLTSITIPDGVISIGESAFWGCTGLKEINISNSVTSIGNSAFTGTPWLKAKQEEDPLVIVNGILINGKNCSGDVVIPDSVTSIDNGAFQYCSALTEITIPDSVADIGDYAFAACSKLMSVTILNPNCEIYDLKATISNNTDYGFYGTIYGYENSTAQEYAEKYGRKFVSLGKADITKGDVNNDGAVDADDASLVLAEYARQQSGQSSGFTEIQLKAADFNGDGAIDSDDASLILAYYAAVSTGKGNE